MNGGVSVAIRSETVSMENAEETRAVIAQHVMDELTRLNQAGAGLRPRTADGVGGVRGADGALAARAAEARLQIANIWTIPPLIYPFQYNPTQITDSKKLDWGPKYDDQRPGAAAPSRGLSGLSGSAPLTEKLGRTFSAAEIKRLPEGGRTQRQLKFTIDGRQLRAGEPSRGATTRADIIGDLAVIRSFVYPQLANWLDMASAVGMAAAAQAGCRRRRRGRTSGSTVRRR